MRIILIYFLLFAFWAELALGVKLTHIKGFSLFNLSIYLLLFAWGYTILTKRRLYESNNINKYIIFLSLVVLCSIFVKYSLGEIYYISIKEEVITFKKWVTPLIIFFLLYNIIDDEKTIKGSVRGLIILLAVTSITTPLMSKNIINIGNVSTSFAGRASGFGGENSFASYVVLFIPLVLTYFLFQKKRMHKVAAGVLLTITLIALFTTGSRGGFLSFLFAMGVYAFILKRQKMIGLSGTIGVFLVVMIISSISFALAPSEPKEILIERLDPTNLEEGEGLDKYTAGRTLLLVYGIQLFLESPIYGHGQKSFQKLVEKFGITAVAHNTYLSYSVEYGLIGLTLFVMLLIKIFQHARKYINETPNAWDKQFYISYLAGFCGYHFSLLALSESQPRYIFWIYTAIMLKYDKIKKD